MIKQSIIFVVAMLAMSLNLPVNAFATEHPAAIHNPLIHINKQQLQVPGQVTDSVTQTNTKVIGTSPGIALSNLYQQQQHALHLLPKHHASPENVLHPANPLNTENLLHPK